MIVTGLIKTGTPNVLSPAIIIDGVVYLFDLGNKVMRAEKVFKESFVIFRFLEEGEALAWWHKNMQIAYKWSINTENKGSCPEYDKELLKSFPVVKIKSRKIKES